MSNHPQPNGGDKPLGNPAVPADKRFVKAHSLFNKHYAQRQELVGLMNRSKDPTCKETIRVQVAALDGFIPEVSGYLASLTASTA